MVYTSLPGQGNFDFVHLAALLREKNFNGAVTMEVYPDDWEKENELRQMCIRDSPYTVAPGNADPLHPTILPAFALHAPVCRLE